MLSFNGLDRDTERKRQKESERPRDTPYSQSSKCIQNDTQTRRWCEKYVVMTFVELMCQHIISYSTAYRPQIEHLWCCFGCFFLLPWAWYAQRHFPIDLCYFHYCWLPKCSWLVSEKCVLRLFHVRQALPAWHSYFSYASVVGLYFRRWPLLSIVLSAIGLFEWKHFPEASVFCPLSLLASVFCPFFANVQ